MASAFSDQLNAIRGEAPPDISKTTKGMTMKFLPDVGIHVEAKDQTKSWT